MGLLLHARTGRLVTLVARSLVGRAPSCCVRIEDRHASAEHAVLSWDGERWEARDLGSLNGTVVDGQPLAASDRRPLRRGSSVGFGVADDPWILADDRGAGPAARNGATGEIRHASGGLLAIPTTADPQATVFRADDGGWLIEVGGEARVVRDRDRLTIDGAEWTMFLPLAIDPIPGTLKVHGKDVTVESLGLEMIVSSDEEHVDIVLEMPGGDPVPLPARSSHYTLLTLARARIDDGARGVVEAERGWVYARDLADALGYTPERVNVEIFRARALFAKIGVVDAARLIERRASSAQLRIGVPRLRVKRHAAHD
jgi:hypothetical protein